MQEYTFIDGRKESIPEIIIPEARYKLFKVNLPDSEESYLTGNGEGVWACGVEETFNAWENDISNEIHFVKILNDSIYYPELVYETIIPVEFRGELRPVAIFDELQGKYGQSHKNEVFKNFS